LLDFSWGQRANFGAAALASPRAYVPSSTSLVLTRTFRTQVH